MPCFALNSELALAADGTVPEWVELIPAANADGTITGRDGRQWRWDAQAHRDVLAAHQARGIDLAIDWEHAIQLRAGNGEEAPAAGWIKQLDLRDGALWGRVEWTPRAKAQVANREYRFLSPVFDFVKATGRIARMVTAGLVNTPNLHLQALNSEEETVMTRSAALVGAITAALGLQADANDDAVAQAINTIKGERDTARAANAEQPALDRYVPRADYDALEARAANAEKALSDQRAEQHKLAVDAAIEGALKAGKITPATEGYHRAACGDSEGLERFRAFVGAAATVGDETDLGKRKPEGTATALNAEQQEACRLLGIPEADYLAEINGAKEIK